MAQRFNPGDKVMVLDYRSRGSSHNNWHSSEVWRGPLTVVKQQRATNRSVSYRSSTTYIDDERGNYVLVKGDDHTYKCHFCDGEGKVLPEGFDPAATYRAKCNNCDGEGEVLVRGYQERFQNRKDKILLVEDYNNTIGAARTAAQEASAERARQKARRIASMMSDLIAVIDAAEDLPEPESLLTRKELAAAKFISNHLSYELQTAAMNFIRKVEEEANVQQSSVR